MKAIFPSGINEITTESVTQWDYGQTLEFEGDLPAVFEVHFAYKGIRQAIVRSCSTASSVTIPDICLEQTSIVVAWIYEIGEVSGKTVKTVYIPITPRVRPEPEEAVPVDIVNKYNESIAAINALIESINTTHSATSDYATEAGHAENADYATEADKAGRAISADVADAAQKAFMDARSNKYFDEEYATKSELTDLASECARLTDLTDSDDYTQTYAIGSIVIFENRTSGTYAPLVGSVIYNGFESNGKSISLVYGESEQEFYFTTDSASEDDEKVLVGNWVICSKLKEGSLDNYSYVYLLQRVS